MSLSLRLLEEDLLCLFSSVFFSSLGVFTGIIHALGIKSQPPIAPLLNARHPITANGVAVMGATGTMVGHPRIQECGESGIKRRTSVSAGPAWTWNRGCPGLQALHWPTMHCHREQEHIQTHPNPSVDNRTQREWRRVPETIRRLGCSYCSYGRKHKRGLNMIYSTYRKYCAKFLGQSFF